MLTQINSDPIQFFTTNPSDLTSITEPHTINTQTTNHTKLSHQFLNPTTSTPHTSSAPYTTSTSNTSTTTYIITLT